MVERLQAMLDNGDGVNEAARELGVKPNTVHQAVRTGRLRVAQKKNAERNELCRKKASARPRPDLRPRAVSPAL